MSHSGEARQLVAFAVAAAGALGFLLAGLGAGRWRRPALGGAFLLAAAGGVVAGPAAAVVYTGFGLVSAVAAGLSRRERPLFLKISAVVLLALLPLSVLSGDGAFKAMQTRLAAEFPRDMAAVQTSFAAAQTRLFARYRGVCQVILDETRTADTPP